MVATAYTLFRGSGNTTNTITAKIGLLENQVSYTNVGLSKDTWYFYWLKAYNALGISGFSSVISNQTYTSISNIPPEIKNAYSEPGSVFNDKDNIVVFNVTAISATTNIINVTLDLSGFNSGVVNMSNISGATQWRYTYLIPSGIEEGMKNIAVAVEDAFNNIITGNIALEIKFQPSYIDTAGTVRVRPNYFKVSDEENDLEIIVPIKESRSRIKIRIYNTAGKLIWDKDDGIYNKGIHHISWELIDKQNNKCKSGIYIVSITINNEKPIIKRVIMIK